MESKIGNGEMSELELTAIAFIVALYFCGCGRGGGRGKQEGQDKKLWDAKPKASLHLS